MKRTGRIIIVRHAESLEDVDNSIYDVLKDLEIPLTEKGRTQASDFGSALSQLLRSSANVRIYTSPGVRNVQTLKIVLPHLPDNLNINVEVDPLLVKQDWGHITAENRPGIEAERYSIGVLRYTFPTGESAEHMIERLKTFMAKILKMQTDSDCDVVVFSHGFEFRILLMLFLGWNEDEFETFGNLANCEYRILTMQDDGSFSINKSLAKHGLPVTRLLPRS